MARDPEGHRVAVLIPCLNEAAAIGQVVADFRQSLPGAEIYVYDNNSTDDSVAIARAAGALVRQEPIQGKGTVVRRMFADIEADAYVLVDGDDTYDAPSAVGMLERMWSERLDMVVARRVHADAESYPPGHRFGNHLFTTAVATLFGNRFQDVLSGYRCFSRRLVKSFPGETHGFDIEAELTIHSLNLGLPCGEVASPYRPRSEGSDSKLSTWRDGSRILLRILVLVKEFRPLLFFTTIAAGLASTSFALGTPIITEFLQTGLVPRFPTAILATGIMILAFLLLSAGMVLDSVAAMRREVHRLAYLAMPGPTAQTIESESGDSPRIHDDRDPEGIRTPGPVA